MMRGGGRVASRRYGCWCEACCLAHHSGTGMSVLLDIPGCKRHHLTSFERSEQTIASTAAAGLANAKARAKDLWKKLKPLLKAGRYCAMQARVLWGQEERQHMRPGHFWVAELGDAGNGSPIIAGPWKERTTYKGVRYDPSEVAVLLRRYYHRTADDPQGLTFMRWQEKKAGLLPTKAAINNHASAA